MSVKGLFMTQAETLYRFQEIEQHIAHRQKRLNEIAALLSNNQAITAAEKQVGDAQQSLQPLQTKVRNLELEIQSNSEKIRQTDDTLYSGRVRVPKEMQDMQQEILSLKKRNSELEDVLLETMLLVEGAEGVLKNSQISLEDVRSVWEKDHQHLLEEQTQLKSEVTQFRQKREDVLPDIAEESLKLYNTLKPRKNNQPVALLIEESCSACRVEQDRNVVAEARKAQKLIVCGSCGRILVYRSG